MHIIVKLIFVFPCLQKKHAARKDRTGEEVTWQLSRFYPVIEVKLQFMNATVSANKLTNKTIIRTYLSLEPSIGIMDHHCGNSMTCLSQFILLNKLQNSMNSYSNLLVRMDFKCIYLRLVL